MLHALNNKVGGAIVAYSQLASDSPQCILCSIVIKPLLLHCVLRYTSGVIPSAVPMGFQFVTACRKWGSEFVHVEGGREGRRGGRELGGWVIIVLPPL